MGMGSREQGRDAKRIGRNPELGVGTSTGNRKQTV